MPRTISSCLTIFFKFVFPPLWIGGFGLVAVESVISGNDHALEIMVAWVAASLFLMFRLVPLKRVRIEGEDLLVSNFLKTIRTPLSNIDDVTENVLTKQQLVWIHFRKPTRFGRKIIFMPPPRLTCFRLHPIVKELCQLAEQAARHDKPDSNTENLT